MLASRVIILIWALPDLEKAWVTVREASWTVMQRGSSHLLVSSMVIRQHAHQKTSRVPSPCLCLRPAEYVYQGDGIIQTVLTTQSIRSPRNEQYSLRNHTATPFHLLWVLRARGNGGVQGGDPSSCSSLERSRKHFRSQEAAGSAGAGSTPELGHLFPESRLCSHNMFS